MLLYKIWDRKVNFDEFKLELGFIKESMARCSANPKRGIGLVFQGKQVSRFQNVQFRSLHLSVRDQVEDPGLCAREGDPPEVD